ncbi:hypothetical protein JCM14202_3834 [Agrilactobacillus composti DSM 18527 = JCM 14202]|uniref:S4 domain-containing protein n=1 Tax=Agrilactobacillus composti TaxID=398555 RepID=UPI00042DEC43|nr:hypothetical protein JCM14202_3834 [Agrilactobacillus composti DSM 18527 = JCM 14202]
MRLDKYLADVTPYSRKDVKLLIKQKRVQVNEILAKTPNYRLMKMLIQSKSTVSRLPIKLYFIMK